MSDQFPEFDYMDTIRDKFEILASKMTRLSFAPDSKLGDFQYGPLLGPRPRPGNLHGDLHGGLDTLTPPMRTLELPFGTYGVVSNGAVFTQAEVDKLANVDWKEAFTTDIFFDPSGQNGMLDTLGLYHWLGGDAALTNKVLDITFTDGTTYFTFRDFIEGNAPASLASPVEAGQLADSLFGAFTPDTFELDILGENHSFTLNGASFTQEELIFLGEYNWYSDLSIYGELGDLDGETPFGGFLRAVKQEFGEARGQEIYDQVMGIDVTYTASDGDPRTYDFGKALYHFSSVPGEWFPSGARADAFVDAFVTSLLGDNSPQRQLGEIDVDGTAEPESHFDLAAERTFNLAGRILEATDGAILSDLTDVELTALTFTLSGHADLVTGDGWGEFVTQNFEGGKYKGGAPDLSMFGPLTEKETITLNLATIEAAITSGTLGEFSTDLSEFNADAWETAFQTFLAPSGEGGRRLNVWETEFSEFWEEFVDVVVPGSEQGASTGATSYAYGVAPAAAGAGEVGLATALAGAGLVIGAELLIAYVAVQAFRTIQHEYKIPVYGTTPSAELEPLLQSKLARAQLAVTPEGGRDEAWGVDMAGEVQVLLDAGDVDGAVQFLRDIESTEGARGVALVFTALDSQSAQQVSQAVIAGMGGRIPPSSKYIDVVLSQGSYSALEDLAFAADTRFLSIGEGIAVTDGALTARNVETISDTAGSGVIADILSVLTVQEFASPGASNIDGFIGLTARLAPRGPHALNQAAKFMAGRRDGSSEALMQVLVSGVYPDLPIEEIFRDANTAATSNYYQLHFGADGSGLTPEGYDETSAGFEALTTAGEKAEFLLTLPVEQQIRLLDTMSAEDAVPVLGALAAADGGIDALIEVLNGVDENTAAGILIVLANSDPARTATLLQSAVEDPVANAPLLEAAASVSTFVLGVLDPSAFVEVVETLAASGLAGADLAARMLNGFSNQEIAAVLTLFENPAARDAIFASDARRGNFVQPGQVNADLGIVDDETRVYANDLAARVESGELTAEEAGQLFFLYEMGIHPTDEQGRRTLSDATPEWAEEQIENLAAGDVPTDTSTQLTQNDTDFAVGVGDAVAETTDDMMAAHGDEIEDFAENAEVGDELQIGEFVFFKADVNLIQVQMRLRYNNIPGDAANPNDPGSSSGKALFVWAQFDRNQLIDGSIGEGNFDFQIVIRPHAYATTDVDLPLGLSFTGVLEAGGEVELSFSTRRGEDGARINRLDEIKAGGYFLPGMVISNVLRYLPKAAGHLVAAAIGQENVAERAEVITNVGMMGLGIAIGPDSGLRAQTRNLFVGEGVRGMLALLPYAAEVTSALDPAEVSALGEAMVNGIEAAYNYFNPGERMEINLPPADLAALGSGDAAAEDVPVPTVAVTSLGVGSLPGPNPIDDENGDIEMGGVSGQARGVLFHAANERRDAFDQPATGDDASSESSFHTPIGEVAEDDTVSESSYQTAIGDGTGDDAPVGDGTDNSIGGLGSYGQRAVEWIAQSFESRTLSVFYFNGFVNWVNNDIVPGREPSEFRGGWNGDFRPDYVSGTAAFVTVSEAELTFRDRTTQQGWQLGVPRLDFVDPTVWFTQAATSEDGRLVLEQRANEDDNSEIRNP